MPMINVRDLHKSYGRNHVLRGIDLEFNEPGIKAVLGPNASGKTTLIKCILGMVIPERGQILVNGNDISGAWGYRDLIDYLPQIARFPENLRVREMIKMVRSLRRRPSDEQTLIDLFDINDVMDQKVGHLSGGTRQKVNLVMALMYNSPLVILDEPSVGLDPVALLQMKDLIRRERDKGKIILITTHILQLVEELADGVVFLLDGKVHFNGSLEELRTKYTSADVESSIAKLLQERKGQVV